MLQPFHARFEAAAPLRLFGVEIRVLMPAAAMEGGLSAFEDRNEPGAGPPLHIHHDADELFHIVEGHYRFHCAGAVIEAGSGDVVLVPKGAPHSYLNVGSGTGRQFVVMRPGGFEGFFQEVAAAGLDVPDDIEEIARIAGRYGLEFLGPNPLAE